MGQRSYGKLLLVTEDRARGTQDLASENEARLDVFDYVEQFYNAIRRYAGVDGRMATGQSQTIIGILEENFTVLKAGVLRWLPHTTIAES